MNHFKVTFRFSALSMGGVTLDVVAEEGEAAIRAARSLAEKEEIRISQERMAKPRPFFLFTLETVGDSIDALALPEKT